MHMTTNGREILRFGNFLKGSGLSSDLVRLGLVAAVAALLWSGRSVGQTTKDSSGARASSRVSAEHLQQYSDLALTWMQEYLRIDTTNPPGNEMRAGVFYKKILDAEGIENRVF